MAWLLICTTSFAASLLTLFSGFGLGTILMPVVAIFLPVPIAIAITAIVHLLNKLFKLLLLWRQVEGRVLLRFGVPALLAAIPGALLLERLSHLDAVGSYALLGHTHVVYPVKLVAGLLLLFFATAEWLPFLRRNTFRRMGLPVGGLLSGFFGGLTGHQGAFRSAFLLPQEYSEVSFIATNAAVAALVDASRLVIYGLTFDRALIEQQATLIALAIAASFLGVSLGARLIRKVTIVLIQRLVTAMMYLLGILLCAGMI